MEQSLHLGRSLPADRLRRSLELMLAISFKFASYALRVTVRVNFYLLVERQKFLHQK